MSSPSKRRKTNSGTKATTSNGRGIDFFFARQRRDAESSTVHDETAGGGLTDEQLARKLQAEWDLEARNSAPVASGSHDDDLKILDEHDEPAENAGQVNDEAESAPQHLQSSEGVKVSESGSTLSLQSASSAEDELSATIPFDTSPLLFQPADYIPQLQRLWAREGGDATYALLTRCFVLVNSTQSRIKIIDTLVNFLRTVIESDPQSLLPSVWLATNSISPAYESLELGLGASALSKSLKQVCGLDNRALKTLYDKYGDAGDVAFEAKKKQSFTLRKPKPLTIKGVLASLIKIAKCQGAGSGEAKQRLVDRLLQDARGAEESRYIVRTLCQHLRIGAVKTTMLIALSRAFLLSRPASADYSLRSPLELSRLKKEELTAVWSRAEEIVKACFARRPNYNDLVPVLLEIGVQDELLIICGLKMHVPLRPMLGSITRDLSEMLTKLQGRDFTCEFKYDGQRAQIHCDETGKVSIFSRHLELMTDKYPDLVALIPRVRGDGVASFILEGEVVAIDRASGDIRPFQTLANRARKDVAIGSIKVDVCMFAFDLMYLNGEPLLDRSLRERRELLRSLFIDVPRQFTWVASIDATSSDSEAVLDFFKSATDTKCEGIMVKVLDNSPPPDLPRDEATSKLSGEANNGKKLTRAGGETGNGSGSDASGRRKALLATYEPDKRLDSWLKVKKDYSTTFDTLDLIPVAGWHGQGRKAKWWSPILLAVRNERTGSLEAVCKCISGFTDAFYKENKTFYDDESGANVLPAKPSFIEYSGGYPDVWFEPQEVWEMAFADITISPTYVAAVGLVDEDRGLSLRFPRFLRKRDDKSIEEASTGEFLAALWRKQMEKAPTEPAIPQNDDDEDE